MTVPNKVLNELFSQKLETTEKREKIEEFGQEYVRDRLLEVSYAHKVNPPQMVTREECEAAVITEDSLIRMVDVHHYDEEGNWLYTTSRSGKVGEKIVQRCTCESHDLRMLRAAENAFCPPEDDE